MWNIVFPRTAIMKKINISRIKTLNKESTDITIVFKSDKSSLFLPANLKTRVTLITRITLAN